jgi:hypothetical protein
MMTEISYSVYRFPPEIIQQVIWRWIPGVPPPRQHERESKRALLCLQFRNVTTPALREVSAKLISAGQVAAPAEPPHAPA